MNNRDKITEFTDLDTWKKAHDLALSVYKNTKNFPQSEQFGLTSQIRRAVVSITSNIAEGFGRQTMKEKLQFYYIAHGSLTETKNQIILAKDLYYLNMEDFEMIMLQSVTVQKLLRGLINKSKTFLN
jgi:four helix bundle protein